MIPCKNKPSSSQSCTHAKAWIPSLDPANRLIHGFAWARTNSVLFVYVCQQFISLREEEYLKQNFRSMHFVTQE